MSIWFNNELTIEQLNALNMNNMAQHIGIVWSQLGDDFLQATMPVDERTKQPFGLLHGGASCVLAETMGSVASALVVDRAKFYCVGLEINANHVRSAREGLVTGIVKPLHIGRQTHVWDIKIYDNQEKLVCISRLTVAVLPVVNS